MDQGATVEPEKSSRQPLTVDQTLVPVHRVLAEFLSERLQKGVQKLSIGRRQEVGTVQPMRTPEYCLSGICRRELLERARDH